jgi:outer membrane beta-barrel protein
MESRLQRFLLRTTAALLLGVAPLSGWAADQPDHDVEPLVVREPERREVRVDAIDSEDFEIGVYGGIMDIEDFGSDTVTGIRAAYHITEDFFIEGTYGRSKLGQTSFESLSGGARLLTDAERDLSYWNGSIGWNILPGESFIGSRFAFKGSLYLLAGAGSTEFGGDSVFTINAGVGYRLIARDWLALHVTAQDHVWESDLLGESATKHNISLTGSLTVFF